MRRPAGAADQGPGEGGRGRALDECPVPGAAAPDTSTLLERDEEVYLAREFLLEQKVRKYDKHKFPPIPPGGKGKDQKGEKGKGKGKGDKGAQPGPKGGKEVEK